jgi:hypothetical protein
MWSMTRDERSNALKNSAGPWQFASPAQKGTIIMISLEDALVVSGERVADCRDALDQEFTDIIGLAEENGFTRKEILVALSELTARELSALPDMPSLH